MVSRPNTICVHLSDEEMNNLRRLAESHSAQAKGRPVSIAEYIQRFARACQPFGGKHPWKHPMTSQTISSSPLQGDDMGQPSS